MTALSAMAPHLTSGGDHPADTRCVSWFLLRAQTPQAPIPSIAHRTSLSAAGFVSWFQDYPRAGNLAGLAVATPLFVAAVAAMGLFADRPGIASHSCRV